MDSLKRLLTAEFLVAAILGVLCMGSYAWQAYVPASDTSAREQGLFNALQFILSVAFAWFSTRAVSRREFEDSLKRFAISAYRRASDIEQMGKRLQSRVANLRTERLQRAEECADLDVIAAVIDNHLQVVSSSLADWSDVIGNELLALEKVRVLEAQRADIHSSNTGAPETSALEHKVEGINTKIAELVATLPTALQVDVVRQEQEQRARNRAVEWLEKQHRRQGGLVLEGISGGQYSAKDPGEHKAGHNMEVRRARDGALDFFDADGNVIGRVLNNSALRYPDFQRAFETCFGASVPVAFIEQTATKVQKDSTLRWFTVRVAAKVINQKPG